MSRLAERERPLIEILRQGLCGGYAVVDAVGQSHVAVRADAVQASAMEL